MVLLGKKIKDLRQSSRYTQTQLATLLGVTKSTVAAYENDSRQPSYEVLIKISSIFNVSLDFLLVGKNSSRLIEVDGLSGHQVYMIEKIIESLKLGNTMEKLLIASSPEMRKELEAFMEDEEIKKIDLG